MRYTDLLIYCPDVNELKAEVTQALPDHSNDEALAINDFFIVDKTPPIWDGDSFVCRIRVADPSLVEQLSTIDIYYEQDEDDLPEEAKEQFNSVNDRTPQVRIEDGTEYTYYPPKIGRFA